jgi:2-oxo-3-hexenedioate decarboxylase
MNEIQITELSQMLYKARKSAAEMESLTKSFGEFPLEAAYRIQDHGIGLRLADGEKVIGYKMGLTSKAKMEQMGLHTPIFGVLTDAMEVQSGAVFDLKNKIHPKAEPEIYFRTNKVLSGLYTPEEAMAACSEIGVALEILDSRYAGFKYFTLPDVVADNSSSAFFVLGESVKTPVELNLKDMNIQIMENGKMVHEATGAAILGDPILSLCELLKLLGEQEKSLPAGSIVLAGAATAAIELKAGQSISAKLAGVGAVGFTVR